VLAIDFMLIDLQSGNQKKGPKGHEKDLGIASDVDCDSSWHSADAAGDVARTPSNARRHESRM
jgi:hypothetical protein